MVVPQGMPHGKAAEQAPRTGVPALEDGTYDLIGVGAGPSNLALAIAVQESVQEAVHEQAAGPGPRALFLERAPRFAWHRDMLLDDTTMQVSFLKDLVTLRNPTSDFSFLSYLHARGRLVDFINHKTLFPLREEFHDYLAWVAARVADRIRYGHEVLAVRPVWTGEEISALEVDARRDDGTTITRRARNLVLGTGLVPRLPEGVTTSARIWHNSTMLTRLRQLDPVAPERFVVVGAGQSAAEVAAYLHDAYPDTEVCSVFARFGYSPADDSPFANRVFDPDAVEEFYSAPADVKRMILDYHGNTNYSVVDLELIQDLYHRSYREKVLGRNRLRCFNVSRVADVVEGPDGLTVDIISLTTGQKIQLAADAVVFCTGYDPVDPAALLGDLASLCRRDLDGRYRVLRDYRLDTAPEFRAGVYLQGGTEHSHGLTSSLLSNTAIRAGEILGSISGRAGQLVG